MAAIMEFKGYYSFLSNFYPSPIIVYDRKWPTVEHAYQAAKTLNFNQQETIRNLATPGKAKRKARTLQLRDDWEEMKDRIMEMLVWEKFYQNRTLSKLLLNTAPHQLVEGNMWHDTYWGVCQCKQHRGGGKNRLGVILMNVRDRLITV